MASATTTPRPTASRAAAAHTPRRRRRRRTASAGGGSARAACGRPAKPAEREARDRQQLARRARSCTVASATASQSVQRRRGDRAGRRSIYITCPSGPPSMSERSAYWRSSRCGRGRRRLRRERLEQPPASPARATASRPPRRRVRSAWAGVSPGTSVERRHHALALAGSG